MSTTSPTIQISLGQNNEVLITSSDLSEIRIFSLEIIKKSSHTHVQIIESLRKNSQETHRRILCYLGNAVGNEQLLTLTQQWESAKNLLLKTGVQDFSDAFLQQDPITKILAIRLAEMKAISTVRNRPVTSSDSLTSRRNLFFIEKHGTFELPHRGDAIVFRFPNEIRKQLEIAQGEILDIITASNSTHDGKPCDAIIVYFGSARTVISELPERRIRF